MSPAGVRRLWQLLIVLGALGLSTIWVERWFIPNWLAPHYRNPFPLLRDYTRGSNMAILFDLLPPPATDGRLRVVLVGDSSIGGGMPIEDFLAWKLRQQLAARFPGRTIEVIDLSIIGLRAQEALLMIAKAFASRPDLVVYAMSPRIAPNDVLWATSVRDLALEWDIVSRIGLRPVLGLLDGTSFARTLVYSSSAPIRLRVPLARALRDATAGTLVGPLVHRLLPSSEPPPQPPDPAGGSAAHHMWNREQYRLVASSPNVRALDTLMSLCAREGRCLLYHIPINPGAVLGFEEGMVGTFAEYIQERATRAGVPYRDFRSVGQPENFRKTLGGNPDAIHPTKEGQQVFAPLLANAVAELVKRSDVGATKGARPATPAS